MLISTMNIEALIKKRMEAGEFLVLEVAPLAAGGFAARLVPSLVASYRRPKPISFEGAKVNWALHNLDQACEGILAIEEVQSWGEKKK